MIAASCVSMHAHSLSQNLVDVFRKCQSSNSVYGFPVDCTVDTGAVSVWQPDKSSVNIIAIYEPVLHFFVFLFSVRISNDFDGIYLICSF